MIHFLYAPKMRPIGLKQVDRLTGETHINDTIIGILNDQVAPLRLTNPWIQRYPLREAV